MVMGSVFLQSNKNKVNSHTKIPFFVFLFIHYLMGSGLFPYDLIDFKNPTFYFKINANSHAGVRNNR